MMKSQKGYTLVPMVIMLFWLVVVVGWIMNIVDIISTIADPITGLFILRCVGIFAFPLGAVLGYF